MTEVVKLGVAEDLRTVHRSLWGDVWRQFYKHKGALVGVIVFVLITLIVFLGPFVYDVDPNSIDFKSRNLTPSLDHPLGTDNIGHDTLAQMLAGGQVSLARWFSGDADRTRAGYFHWRTRWVYQGFGRPVDAIDRSFPGSAHTATATSYYPVVPRYPTEPLWSGSRYFHADRLRDRYNELDEYGKNCAWRRARYQGARVRPRSPQHRCATPQDYLQTHTAQRFEPDHGVGNTRDCQCHHHGVGTVLSGPRISTGFPDLGQAAL